MSAPRWQPRRLGESAVRLCFVAGALVLALASLWWAWWRWRQWAGAAAGPGLPYAAVGVCGGTVLAAVAAPGRRLRCGVLFALGCLPGALCVGQVRQALSFSLAVARAEIAEGDGGRVTAHLVADHGDIGPLAPGLQLIDGGCAEGVSGHNQDLLPAALEMGRQLAQGGGLPHPVHAHQEEDLGARGLQGASGDLAKDLEEFVLQ